MIHLRSKNSVSRLYAFRARYLLYLRQRKTCIALIRARVAGVRPNSEQKDCMIFRFCWTMDTFGTCCTCRKGY